MISRRAWLGAVGAAALACASRRPRVGAADAPAIARPEDLVPGDLDLVVRLDLERIRSAIGPGRFEQLARAAARGSLVAARGDPVVDRALLQARTVWLAVRPDRRLELVDGVLVMTGTFRELDPPSLGASPAWSGPSDRGGDVRAHSRAGRVPRGAPAYLWLRSNDLVVVATTAEIDSVERALAGDRLGARLEPPARGAISIAARTEAFLDVVRRAAPLVARLLEGSREVSGWADVDAEGLEGELELRCAEAAVATELAEVLGAALGALAAGEGAGARLAGALRPRAVADRVVFTLALDHEALAAVAVCLGDLGC